MRDNNEWKGKTIGSAKIQKVYYILHNTLTILGHFNPILNNTFILSQFCFADVTVVISHQINHFFKNKKLKIKG
jgi:hypothetical protein